MTAQQMKYEWEVGYDRITNFDAPGYNEKEISTFLTKAQEQLVLELYRNGNHYKEEFKKSLNMLKTPHDIVVFAAGPYPLSFVGALPADVLVVYNEVGALTTNTSHVYPSATLTDVHVKPVDDDFYHLNKKNPFKKPSVKNDLIWRLDFHTTTVKQHVYVVEANCTLTKVTVHYYKKPSPIIIPWSSYVVGDGSIDGVNWSAHTVASMDCALDPITHRDIVDRAVLLAYAAIQDEKGVQLSMAQEQLKNKN